MGPKVEYLIADTTAFIKSYSLQELSEKIFTVQEVVDEIKNKRQLRRLVVLPYDLQIKDVFTENIAFITDFAKKTGDYPSLSATDIKVMALTYQLEKEKVGTEHLKLEPTVNRTVSFSAAKPSDTCPEMQAGFYLSHKKVSKVLDEEVTDKMASLNCGTNEDHCTTELESRNLSESDGEEGAPYEDAEDRVLESDDSFRDCREDLSGSEVEEEDSCFDVNDILIPVTSLDGSSDDYDYEEEDSDSDGEDAWITPGNINQVKKGMNFKGNEDAKSYVVACITSDFAMQNVLMQLGLKVVSVDGKIIRHLRTFILRCYGCHKTTSIMTKLFCPNCGNKTLKKVAVSIKEDGTQHIHINARRPLTARGKKFSLPMPKGGKHANNPILVEDQRLPQQHASRLARQKNDPLAPDYIAGFSPFIMRDVSSRSAMLGIRPSETKHWMRKNPNEARRRSSKKKK
ncbi:RNA-binding protein NOB1 [Bacillus rossius redtenbacheri]|uniref:RNA-binding protein NOB1 n=1 Tax=Bacillus rossius redtenbacheri TaxID=93214 RepID=UPI002FDDEF4A